MPALPFCHVILKAKKPEQKPYPKELKTIGNHMRKRRLDLGLMQKEVAEQLGVTESSINNWEHNRTTPELRCLSPIVHFLGYNPMPKPSTIAERLLFFRRSRSLSQGVLAKLIGVDQSTLAKWERSEREPKGRTLGLIRDFFRRS